MKIKSKHLDEAVSEEIISKEQSVALRAFLESRADIGPTFNFTNLLYYFGGLIAIGAKLKPFDTNDYRLIAGTYDSTRAAIF